MTTVPVTFYGASDDLIELETPDRSIYDEYDCYARPCRVKFTAPNGETLTAEGEFGYDGWQLKVLSNDNDWKVEESVRPDRVTDPALIIHAPVGTVAEEV